MANKETENCEKFKTMIGGQALIEGIMMRGPEKDAIVIRGKDGLTVEVSPRKLNPPDSWKNWPFIRGIFNFFDAQIVGVKALLRSADLAPDEMQEEPSKFDKWLEKKLGSEAFQKAIVGIAVAMGLLLSIGLFFLLPMVIGGFFDKIITSTLLLNLVEGVIRMVIFMAYMILVSRMPDMKRVFSYHGAEHKTIRCAPPIGNAGIDQLKRYDAAYIGSTSEKVLYLTFDAGYENGCTEKILDTLQKHNVKAAFFLVGNYIEKNADLVRRMAEEGHIVGNHTMHHYDMSKISEKAAFTKELQDLETLYKDTTGQDMPKYYRPPQGIYSEENLRMAQELGYRTVFWSLAYVDWNNDSQPTREQAFAKLLPRTHPGAVVLLHSTSKTNAEILDELLTKWEEEGYRFATVEELFAS